MSAETDLLNVRLTGMKIFGGRRERPSKSVVVTGASTGIGRATAMLLAKRGFRVFAGVRNPWDAESLRSEGGARVIPIQIDVTDARSIAAAVDEIEQHLDGEGLDGLVNNAGIGVAVPVEGVAAEILRHHFEVDVFGQIAVTQAFLPLIRRNRGRIVNMGSVGGHITMPFGGILCGCKSALGSISDALRLELHPFGIRVSVVEPGAIHTPAVEKTLGDVEGAIAALPVATARRYGPLLRRVVRRAYEREKNGSPPEVVARVVHRALVARRPRIRYRVGRDARLLTALPRFLPDRVLDAARLRVFGMPTSFGALLRRGPEGESPV
jgi:NAD(P)-dependent dehydrogenase (short-subunit alcohol dehydrogenase family)